MAINACIKSFVCLHVGPLYLVLRLFLLMRRSKSSNVGSPLVLLSKFSGMHVVDIVKSCPVAIPSARAFDVYAECVSPDMKQCGKKYNDKNFFFVERT